MNFDLMFENIPALLAGVPLTLQLVSLSVSIGFILSLGLVVAGRSRFRPLAAFSRGYVFFFRGTPLLVQLFLIYYGVSQFDTIRDSFLWVVFREPYWCAVIALALNTAAYASEIMRGGVLSVPNGYIEAAQALGMSRLRVVSRVIVPVAARQALPAYGNELILMVKATSLASTVTLLEVTGIARQIISRTYAVFEIFIAAGAIYLAINSVAVLVLQGMEIWLHPERGRSRSNGRWANILRVYRA